MRIFTSTPYKLVTIDGTVDPGRPQMAFIVKASFQLVNGRPLVPLPADLQPAPCGEAQFMDEIGRSLRYPGDLAIFKPFGEVTLTGDCHVPHSKPHHEVVVALRIGEIAKSLRVTGDRVWVRNQLGELVVEGPRPFRTMPLRWERAFGGLAVADNPMGRGIDVWPTERGRHLYLANIEDPHHLVSTPQDRPRPACFAPIPSNWQPRMARHGTRDLHWSTFIAPLPPADHDPAFAQTAPQDQWLQSFWRGDEPIELTNLHPAHAQLSTALPGLRLRLFAECAQREAGETRFLELPLACDTVHIDTTQDTVVLLFRHHFRPASAGAPEILACYLAEEHLAEPAASIDAHHKAYLELRGPAPEATRVQALRDEKAALNEARKTLVDAGIDPAVIARFDAASGSSDKATIVIDLLKAKTAELETMTAALKGG